MAGLFDDLIASAPAPSGGEAVPASAPTAAPAAARGKPGGMFDDLLAQAAPRGDPAPLPLPVRVRPQVAAVDDLGRPVEDVASPEARAGITGAVDAAVRGAANGATFGLADKIAAGMGALTGIGGTAGDYAGNLEAQRAASKEAEHEHPVAAIGGELAGGLVPARAAMKAGVSLIPRVAERGLGMRAGAMALEGAGYGALSGAGHTDGDVEDYAKNAGSSAAFGSAVGMLTPFATSVLSGAYRFGAPLLARSVPGGNAGADALLQRAAPGMTPDQVRQAAALIDDGKARGVELTWPEALQHVMGPNRLGDLQRVVEGQGGMSDFFAARPAQVEQAGRSAFDAVAPVNTAPTAVGGALQDAAQAGVAQTPQGVALTRALEATGPRVTQDQAGQTIQREMRGVADRLEAQRTADAAQDYAAARAAPENVGVERTVTVERPGEPVLQTLDTGTPGAPAYAPPPDGPMRLSDLAPTRPEGPEVASAGPSLARFIAQNGGIGLERGDLKAAGLDKFRQPGVASLVRENGKSIDGHWRESLIEHGYLPPDADGGMARNIHDELIGLLQEEARGRPTYPGDWQGRNDIGSFGAARDEFSAASSQASADIRNALRGAGVDPKSVHPDIMDRATAALMRGDETDPLRAFERTVMASREPVPRGPTSREVPTTVTEEISAPRFGQANPQAAIDAIDRQLRTAKGDTVGALEATRRDLYGRTPDAVSGQRETDLTVEGLLHARERLDRRIADARELGDGTKVRDLQIARSALDEGLKGVPEVASADARFAANSRPLEPFGGNTPLGRTTARDDLTGRMATPAEQVPSLLSGATATREFLANATPAARTAYEGRVSTQILDQASEGRGGVSAERLRAAMREHEDVLAQMPAVRDRLSVVAVAREGMAAVERSPLGKIASRPDVKAAIATLFPAEPLANSAAEVGQTMRALVRNDPRAARDLIRIHAETVFNRATEDLASGPNQAGGAKFAAMLRGDSGQAANLKAAVEALPGGDRVWSGFDRFLEIMEATGQRRGIGSRTAFNADILSKLRNGGIAKETASIALGGGLKLPEKVKMAFEEWQAGKNVEALASVFTSREAEARLIQLATAKGATHRLEVAGKVATLAWAGSRGGKN